MKTTDFVKIVAWDMLNPLLLRIKKKRRYKIKEGINGINLGCGLHNPKNWIGVDGGFTHYIVNKLPKPLFKLFFKSQKMSKNYVFDEYYKLSKSIKLVHHELQYGLPYNDNSAPNIFSSHFFEHIFKNEAEALTKECYRVLKPGGIIRICVPSLLNEIEAIENAIKAYKANGSDNIQKYVTSNIVGFNSTYSNHRYIYDWEKLSSMFKASGFKDIKQYEFQQGEIPDVKVLDTRDGLFIEATK
jgi:predicted SAM-dependent methyltransferase